MRLLVSLCLLMGLVMNCNSLMAQRYSHLINQAFQESDLRYMPVAELNVLKNEIIALQGAQTNKLGVENGANQAFLSDRDRANLALIETMKEENRQLNCSDQALFELFHQLALHRQNMPIYLAEKFYGVALSADMLPYQKVIPLNDEIIAFWVPFFPKDCDICPYHNHFSTVNILTGERIANLETKGILTLLEDNILEIKKLTIIAEDTATQPEYYQLMDNGQLISKENQVVRLEQQH